MKTIFDLGFVIYLGPGLSNFDVGAIRGNRIPSEVELFYYEMSVINKGIHGLVLIN